jgi:mannosyltransferase OCH1-like enzyme
LKKSRIRLGRRFQLGSMSLMDRVRYRLIKIFANASKILFSMHLRLFPSVRKEIPAYAPALTPALTERRIPRIIWQTNYTRNVTRQVYSCFRYNRRLSATHEYHLYDDAECDKFVKEHYPGEIWRAYQRLQIGAARADLWRILALLKFGGIYLDIDANLVDSPDHFIDKDAEAVFIATKSGEVTNYFLASAPENPVLREVCARIVKNINENSTTCVYNLTGPVVLDAVVKEHGLPCLSYKKACIQGQFTNKFGQYADKPHGVWTVAQKVIPVLADDVPQDESAAGGPLSSSGA